jgi:hypothetical protein
MSPDATRNGHHVPGIHRVPDSIAPDRSNLLGIGGFVISHEQGQETHFGHFSDILIRFTLEV